MHADNSFNQPRIIDCYAQIASAGGLSGAVRTEIEKVTIMASKFIIENETADGLFIKESRFSLSFESESSVANFLDQRLSLVVKNIRNKLKLKDKNLVSYRVVGCHTTLLNQENLMLDNAWK